MSTLDRIDDPGRPTVCDVVFVHGLNGDAHKTWQNEASAPGDAWPEWVARAHPDAAVWTVGYEAAALSWFGAAMSVQDRAANLLARLAGDGLGTRPLAFITHSMGGLIVKAMLREAQGPGSKTFGALARNTRLIVFVAVPHEGSQIASYLAALGKILPSSAATRDLQRAAPQLIDLNRSFRAYVEEHQPAVVSFYESLPVHGAMVVPRESADFGYPHHVAIPLALDHIAAAKPASPETEVVKWTGENLRRFVLEAVQAHEAPQTIAPPVPPAALTYARPTAMDGACAGALLETQGEATITYAPPIAEAVAALRDRDMNPDAYLGAIVGAADTDEAQRRRRKAFFHTYNAKLLVKADRVIAHNAEALNRLLSRLRDLDPGPRLAAVALQTFATFAALGMIRALSDGFEWMEDGPRGWFEGFLFSSDGSGSLFDCVPNRSDTGQLAFGYSQWVTARVGHETRFEYVTLPLDVALPLFRTGVRGDEEAFFTWVLPQLILHSDQPVESFPMDWEAFLLRGAQGTEWWSRFQRSPWPGVVLE